MMSRIDRLKREKYVLGNPTEIEKLKKWNECLLLRCIDNYIWRCSDYHGSFYITQRIPAYR